MRIRQRRSVLSDHDRDRYDVAVDTAERLREAEERFLPPPTWTGGEPEPELDEEPDEPSLDEWRKQMSPAEWRDFYA